MSLSQSNENIFRKKMNENRDEAKIKSKLAWCTLIYLVFFSPYIFFIYIMYFNYGKKNKDKIDSIKIPFAINIDNGANLDERIEEGFIDLSLNSSNKKGYQFYMNNYSTFHIFDNLVELNIYKLIDLEKENLDKNNMNILKNNNNKLYDLISYIVEKQILHISNTYEIKLKKKYQDKFKNITKLENENEKKQKIKKLIDRIGLYIPTKIILGGRIDISFEINREDKEMIDSNRDKIFSPPYNFAKKMKNYSCKCKGGSIDFCKNNNINKWQESINDENMDIIWYQDFYKIYDYLEEDLIKYFIKELRKDFEEGIYYGKVVNGQRNGYGRLEYKDDSIYEGNWKNNLKDGKGEYKRNDGFVFSGYWKNDFMNGEGSLRINGELKYEGNWIDNKRNGQGISFKNNIKVYEGNWVDDKKNGNGTSYENGIKVYEGNWVDDKKHGYGTSYENGIKVAYEGNWVDDKKNGKGISYVNGIKVYNGQWANDQYHGQGIWYYNSDDSNRWIKARFENGECKEYSEYSDWRARGYAILHCWKYF